MMKGKIRVNAIAIALALCLCGCGSAFDKEYVAVSDYVPTAQEDTSDIERVSVHNYSKMKQAILQLVMDGKTGGVIEIDSSYDGDVKNALTNACWQIRTQNALCAYCVDNITFELSKIVTYYEAKIIISYVESAVPLSSVITLPYSSGAESVLKDALEHDITKLAIVIGASSYSADDMESFVLSVYEKYPTCVVRAPRVQVNLYSGANLQRLYEINIVYNISPEEAEAKREAISNLDVWADVDIESMNLPSRALAACRFLTDNCDYTLDNGHNTVFTALLDGEADSEGLALAYVELCRQLGVDCRIVYGQKDWQSHCWNIVELDGAFYHVDISKCIEDGIENGFLLNDEKMWSAYRWDMGSYESCGGSLSYASVA